ncbi:MAG: alkaline phosphatase family protein [Planctomycetota bacterium]|jgi:predicted AlkP superfamily phosphohydrolase/phosphomutase
MRRIVELIALAGVLATAWLSAPGCSGSADTDVDRDQRVLILGVDGMDPRLLSGLMAAGRVPNLSRLAADGSYRVLDTSAPPQSPVAWSNFICGADPGTHNIFDFIHRDPAPEHPGLAVEPYLSTSTIEPPKRDWAISFGDWQIPLFGPKNVLLRRGGAFWDDLIQHGVQTVVYRMPANYPPPEIDGKHFSCLCGMGTPDLLGTYGEFTFLTPDAPLGGRMVGGGRFSRLRLRNHRGTGKLVGPQNYLRKPDSRGSVPDLTAEVEVVRDPKASVAKITIGDELVLLKEGEWSDWVPVVFETGIPGSTVLGAMQLPTSIQAMVRLYLKSVHPKLELYVTPINIDPLKQVTPVGVPGDFPREIAEACGRYYTTGIPEDTKALRSGALTEDEFLAQVEILKQERIKQFRYALESFDRGCLFFYFGHTDQLAHIFWRDRDPGHPAHDAEEAKRYGSVIEDTYIEMDGLVGEALAALDDNDTLIVMSDHGFTSFRRGLNLNSWLIDAGYMTMIDGVSQEQSVYLAGVDWSKTKAYALGLNAMYINQAGREREGSVPPGARAALLQELSEKMREIRDTDGAPVIDTVYVVDEYYPNADRNIAPDILVGYADTYRASWSTAEGGSPLDLLEDNHDRWCGDHCIAHEIVPGILVTNRSVTVDDPNLTDLAPSVLNLYGIPAPEEMTGRVLFAPDDES